ncbi:uncharacterized protein N7483_007414 [Penicillium malachiteum]|uniref:uncharacterized protein n=1 Tax=Penicillium malachiteum TaxID=1324776 RepID=UPI002548EBA3|nr:uncharacterized protein N7483_007414 [Penicillium malachiteum]KAJ5726057.1 hypothetical protein N7483_007414 [Penicillium malachiteum]
MNSASLPSVGSSELLSPDVFSALPPSHSSQTSTQPERHALDTLPRQQPQPVSATYMDPINFTVMNQGQFELPAPAVGALPLPHGQIDDASLFSTRHDTTIPRSSHSQETTINGQFDSQSPYQVETVSQNMGPWIEDYTAMLVRSTGSLRSPVLEERCHQLRNMIRLLEEHGDQELEGQQSQTPVERVARSAVTNGVVTPWYECMHCEAVFYHYPSFQRHIESLHFARCMYSCGVPGCDHVEIRRDKMRTHSLEAHTLRVTPAELDGMKTDIPCPGKCEICPKLVRNWQEFYKCWISHCTFEAGPVDSNGPPGGGDDNPGNGGAGPSSRNGSRLAGRSGAGMGPPRPAQRGNRRRGGGVTRRRGGNQRSMNQLSPIVTRAIRRMPPTREALQPNTPSTQDERRNSMGEGIALRPAQHGSTMRVHQPAGQARPLPSEQLHCRICNHIFMACDECCYFTMSAYGCHECSEAIRRMSLTTRIQFVLRGESYQVAFLTSQNSQTGGSIGGTAQAAGFPQYGRYNHQQPPDYHHQDGGGGSNGPFGGSAINPRALMVTIAEHHLDEHDFDLGDLKSSTSQFSAACPSLPIRFLLPKSISELPQMKSLITGCMYTKPHPLLIRNLTTVIFASSNKLDDFLGKNSSLRTDPTFPANEPTVLETPMPGPPMDLEAHKGQTCVELVPGKLLYVDMKILPEERGGSHPLRTRVRVVVKLFKLRSSVARAGNKKTKEDAETIEKALCKSLNGLSLGSESVKVTEGHDENPSDVESDIDGIFSDTASEVSLASEDPISHHPLLLHEKPELFEIETEFDISMDIELNSLSAWTDAFADLEANLEASLGADKKFVDSRRVFEVLFRYILYVIFGSRRFRSHGSYHKLLE